MQNYQDKTREEILEFLISIPKGKVVTYKYLAERFGLHPRTIARILSLNNNQDRYPCYKVVKSNGDVGGYNLGRGEKIRRLKKEGIEINNGKIDLSKYLFEGD